MNARRTVQGFSLIEVAITLTIAALLVLFGLPSFQAWLQNTQIRNAAESIQNGIARARMEAVRSNQNVRFTLVSLTDPRNMDSSCAASAAGRSWVVSLDAPDGECDEAPDTTTAPRIIETHAAGDGNLSTVVDAKDADGAAATTLTFNGFGRLTGAKPISTIGLSSAVSGDYRVLRVAVTPAGAVRLCDPAVDSSDPRSC
jgi:type IV fimbrial biogenesis protein FimT